MQIKTIGDLRKTIKGMGDDERICKYNATFDSFQALCFAKLDPNDSDDQEVMEDYGVSCYFS